MILPEFDIKIGKEILGLENIEQLKEILAYLADYNIKVTKILNDLLINLDSDNVTSLDLKKTKLYGTKPLIDAIIAETDKRYEPIQPTE